MSPRRHAEEVMGTVFSFAVVGGDDSATEEACRFLHQVDRDFSTWIEDSWISRLRRGDVELAAAPAVIQEVHGLCLEALRASRGWFDPWRQPGGFDPTGLVKGWATERAAEMLRGAGAAAAMVNGAGDIACFGRPRPDRDWRIGLEDPFDPSRIAMVVQGWPAVATSGTYQRGPHLIHPTSGLPALSVRAATVIGPRLWLADALATAAAVAGARAGMEMVEEVEGYELLVVGEDGRRSRTSGFAAEAA
ncbi:MAG TPA: FAD:protein FMN transferase [Acidimicrobiales bacterium]|nr:FAD:protein FMN transferase [Acidimicrobiales bacterium]